MIEILETGASATVQDLGRAGFAALGVPRSGAFDRAALRSANRLVGNRAAAAGIESLLGGLVVRATQAVTVAVAGAACPVTATGVSGAWGLAVTLPAGAVLRLGHPARGLRCYLAVRGGLDLDPVLGSRSTDSLSGLGPLPLAPGDRLAVGVPDEGQVSAAALVGAGASRPVHVRFGPRDDWFTDPAVLLRTRWTVRGDSDRVGLRLDGPPIERMDTRELPSEGMRPGAVQVPGDGRPIIFGPDAPVTGGYPVIAVVRDLDLIAQLRPGDSVGFVA